MSRTSVIKADEFGHEVLECPCPVLVQFYAVWCKPCREIEPHLERLAEELGPGIRIVKVDADEEHELAYSYGITGLPAFLLFHRGRLIDELHGAPSSEELKAWFREKSSGFEE